MKISFRLSLIIFAAHKLFPLHVMILQLACLFACSVHAYVMGPWVGGIDFKGVLLLRLCLLCRWYDELRYNSTLNPKP